ncbi:MAG: recombinase family protein, partial [Stenotrophomonas sp.]
AAGRGWSVVGTFTDAAISGSAMANRPGLLNALDAAARGEFDLLLAEDWDGITQRAREQVREGAESLVHADLPEHIEGVSASTVCQRTWQWSTP